MERGGNEPPFHHQRECAPIGIPSIDGPQVRSLACPLVGRCHPLETRKSQKYTHPQQAEGTDSTKTRCGISGRFSPIIKSSMGDMNRVGRLWIDGQ